MVIGMNVIINRRPLLDNINCCVVDERVKDLLTYCLNLWFRLGAIVEGNAKHDGMTLMSAWRA